MPELMKDTDVFSVHASPSGSSQASSSRASRGKGQKSNRSHCNYDVSFQFTPRKNTLDPFRNGIGAKTKREYTVGIVMKSVYEFLITLPHKHSDKHPSSSRASRGAGQNKSIIAINKSGNESFQFTPNQKKCQRGFFTGHGPGHCRVRTVSKPRGSSRLGPGGVAIFTGRVGSGQEVFQDHGVGSGRFQNHAGRVG